MTYWLLESGEYVDEFATEAEAWAYALEYRQHMPGYVSVVSWAT